MNSLRSDLGVRTNEKRTKPRVGVRGRVQIAPIRPDGTAETLFDVWVRDLSTNGIGILHTKPLAEGSQFEAYFKRHNDGPLILTYIVAHTKSVVKGLFTVGAHLVNINDTGGNKSGLMSN